MRMLLKSFVTRETPLRGESRDPPSAGKLGIDEDRINLQGEEREKHDLGVSRN